MRDDAKMDANRLIAEVYKRPALWNQRHISYHNRDVTNRIWTDIAALLKLPKQLLKTKWKGLRDTFRAEIKKEQAYRKTKFARNRAVWIHFKSLQFLKEQMLPRPAIWDRANCPAADRNNDASRESSGVGTNKPLARTVLRRRMNNNSSGSSRNVVASDTTTLKNNRRGVRTSARMGINDNREMCCENVMTSLMIIDGDETSADILDDANNSITNDRNKRMENSSSLQVKLEPLEHCELHIGDASHDHHHENVTTDLVQSSAAVVIGGDTALERGDKINVIDPLGGSINSRYDDNYYFLVSLLPHIRSLPGERRMLLRMQMQQLVYQEVYKKSPASSVNQRITATTTSDSARGSSSPLRDKQS